MTGEDGYYFTNLVSVEVLHKIVFYLEGGIPNKGKHSITLKGN